jgi:hypothetical protein
MYSHIDVNTSIREKVVLVKRENAVKAFEGGWGVVALE